MDSFINFTNFSVSAAAAAWEGCRESQDDTVWLSDVEQAAAAGSFMAVLSDGMGSEEGGQGASKLIVSTYVNSHITRGGDSLACFLNTANATLRRAKDEGAIKQTAGATLIAARVTEKGIEWQSVGDSLLYLQRDGAVKKLNTAHTWEQNHTSEVELNQITEEHPQAHAESKSAYPLYEVVSSDAINNHNEETAVCQPGDRYIMVSDDFTPLIETAWEELLNSPGVRQAPPTEACEVLLMKLKKMNTEEQNNASIIIFDVVEKQENTALPPTQNSVEDNIAESNNEAKAIELQLIGDRSSQQDSVGHWYSEKAILAVVADGAGGHVGGAQASQTAVATMEYYWQEKLCAGVSAAEAAEILTEAVQQAHTNIIQQAGGNATLSGKSAFVAVYLHDGYYTCINVGDCRAYVTHQGKWKQLSIDDSLLRILVDKGEVTPAEAKNHPDQNILTQALGTESKIKPHVSHGTFSKQDSFLLCCDGLWNQLPEEQWPLANWDATSTAQYKNVLTIMVNKAFLAANGSSDNVSAVWICAETPEKAAFIPPIAPQQSPPTNILQPSVSKIIWTAIGLLLITTILLVLCSSPDQPRRDSEPTSKSALPAEAQVKSAVPQNGATSTTTAPNIATSTPMPPPATASTAGCPSTTQSAPTTTTPLPANGDVTGDTPSSLDEPKSPTPLPANGNVAGDTPSSLDEPKSPTPLPANGDVDGNTPTSLDEPKSPTLIPANEDELGDTPTSLDEPKFPTPLPANEDEFGETPTTDDFTNDTHLPNNGTSEGTESKRESPSDQDKLNSSYTTTISSVSFISGNHSITYVSYRCDNIYSFRYSRRRPQRHCEYVDYPTPEEYATEEVSFDIFFKHILPDTQMTLW